MSLDLPVCANCGVQMATPDPPELCPICDDDREYVRAGGQAWTTRAALLGTHRNLAARMDEERAQSEASPRTCC